MATAIGKTLGVTGLTNIGNSCFLNAVLQSLASLSSFRTFIENSHASRRWKGSFSLLHLLQATLEDVSAVGNHAEPPQVSKHKLLRKKFLSKKEQQDAHELMQFLLNTLNEESKSPSLISLTKKENNDSPFFGVLKNTMQCCQCKRVSLPTYQKFSDISLSLPPNKRGGVSLEECLSYFTAAETVSDVDCSSWVYQEAPFFEQSKHQKCTGLGTLNTARKKLTIARAPKILCLHIRRLVNTDIGFSKVGSHIRFPEELDLASFCSFDLSESSVPEDDKHGPTPSFPVTDLDSILNSNAKSCVGGDSAFSKLLHNDFNPAHFDHDNPPKTLNTKGSFTPLLYNLVSVIEHRGSHSSGHYTAYRKLVAPDTRKAEWFFISDDHVSPVTVEHVLTNAQAYMLYYEREDKSS